MKYNSMKRNSIKMTMKKFIGRKNELKTLQSMFEADGFQMAVIYGRRRIGKSTLIREFIKDKHAVYFTATRAGLNANVEALGRAVLTVLAPDMNSLAFPGVDELLTFIGERCRQQRTIIVIDELSYFAEADKSFLSYMQKYIDEQWIYGQMMLIVCGSSVSFMEDEVLSEKSPLFGRRTGQIKLDAFDYLEAAEFVSGYSPEDKALCYGVTGGIAKYLSLIDDKLSIDDNIKQQFFSKTGYLYEEANNLLTQEFRNVSTYNDIITAIATGSDRINEIADKTHNDSTVVSHAAANLITTGIVEKQLAITNESNKRKVLYVLRDGMFRFWYKFVPNAMSLIELGLGDRYYDNVVKARLSEYMGSIFEDMCRYYTLRHGANGDFGCFITETGRWWGSDPKKKETTDIDVVGLDKLTKQAVLGECKYKNEPADKSVYDALTARNGLIDNSYSVCRYLLFSKSGFTDWVRDKAAEDSGLGLIELKDMY